MITTTFDDLLDGESFVVLDSDYWYREGGTYYVFEKMVPFTVYQDRPHVMNARRMPDDCYCTVPGHLPVVKVGVLNWQLASQWDFEGATRKEPRMEIDYGDALDE